jgi:hypothetical protein
MEVLSLYNSYKKGLKIAKVIPFLKPLKKEELKNYRPAFSKTVEKIIFNKIMAFMMVEIFYTNTNMVFHPIINLLNSCASANNSHPKQITAMIICDSKHLMLLVTLFSSQNWNTVG